MPKRTTAADAVTIRVVLLTMDSHLSSATARAAATLKRELPGLSLSIHAADEWAGDPQALASCTGAIAEAHIIVATMLFMEDHYQPVLDALIARRADCDALLCAMSAGEVVRLTRLGRFDMQAKQSGPMALLRRLRGSKNPAQSSGARQLQMLRRLPKILRYIPGTAQDVRAYFLALQYWLAGSEENIAGLVRLLVYRYASGPREGLRQSAWPAPPVSYPDVGLYHPALKTKITERLEDLPAKGQQGTVGLLLLRSYLLSGNAGHYDGVIAALEARGLNVIPAFSAGLDARPAIDRYFRKDGETRIDVLLSLSGFSMVGGPAYNDSKAAEDCMAALDVPYLSAHPVEFQTLEQWQESDRGLMPVEATIMVAIPELDGATSPMVFGGRAGTGGQRGDMQVHAERVRTLAARVAKWAALRRRARAERRLAIVLFNFPPNAGNTGSAAFLSVFESLHATLSRLRSEGYRVDVPPSVEALREMIVNGNAAQYGAIANVHKRIGAQEHVRREAHLAEIEKQWGAAPGKQLSDGASLFILGAQFGQVFVGLQPAFGYEGDPMRLLYEKGHAPTHAFSAFYRFLREDFAADAVLHFGTHGALEFMPGKQVGMSGACWPDRLIGDLPNLYLYASNNPSEGAIAKRRTGATLISYLTPPITQAGLYRGLSELKALLESHRRVPAGDTTALRALESRLQGQAADLQLIAATPAWGSDAGLHIDALRNQLTELEYTLIPHGLHVLGRGASREQCAELMEAMLGERIAEPALRTRAAAALAAGEVLPALPRETADAVQELATTCRHLETNAELDAVVQALDARFIRPAPGGDLLRTPAVLPTGRNLHGFDPFRLPSSFAMMQGVQQAAALLARHTQDGTPLPESVALVLWGTDNLKTEGSPIGQALSLLGAAPRFDSYGRIAGATLLPLQELGRPRIDVVLTLSGIFRDLLPLQVKMLAEAAWLAASADEPPEQNFVRKHALHYQQVHGCDLETAALRVYGNAESNYGAHVNHLIENGRWDDSEELAETFTRRKSFAYGRDGRPTQQSKLLTTILAGVDLSYQNLDSIEIGVTTVDTYFDTLGGIASAVRRAKGGVATPVYIADHTQGAGGIRTLAEQVNLESRTRTLNPKWFEGLLAHGYEGVRQIEAHITNTMGWSATTGDVQPWVYEHITRTFILDPEMRKRLADMNPTASTKMANRLLEASQRHYWEPSQEVLAALTAAGEELEDRLEGVAA